MARKCGQNSGSCSTAWTRCRCCCAPAGPSTGRVLAGGVQDLNSSTSESSRAVLCSAAEEVRHCAQGCGLLVRLGRFAARWPRCPPRRAKNGEQPGRQALDDGAEAGPHIRPNGAPGCTVGLEETLRCTLPRQHGTEGAHRRFRNNCQPARSTHDSRWAGGPEQATPRELAAVSPAPSWPRLDGVAPKPLADTSVTQQAPASPPPTMVEAKTAEGQ